MSINCIEYVLINYRWIFTCFFLMPLSFLYDIVFYLRNWIIFKMYSAPEKHQQRVKYVQKQIRKWNEDGRKTKLCTARPGWMAMSFRVGKYKSSLKNIHINLMDILEVDPHKKIIRAEPLVTMGQITATLEPLGWTLPIVPELDDLTVGGTIMGTGIESSSHHFGLMQHICEAFELVLADGSCIRCTRDEHSDLFYSVPWSHGTLGFLVSAELSIIKAEKFVQLTYEPLKELKDITNKYQEAVLDKSNQFVEMLVYSEKEAVLMKGKFACNAPLSQVNSIGRWYKPWFFKHVEQFLQTGKSTEYIPLRDYYHRHTRSIFWQLQDIIPFGNNAIFRYLFGWMVPPKISLLKLTQGETVKRMYEENQIIQDMLVPMNKLESSLKFFDEALKLYPLWICPFKLPQNPGFLRGGNDKNDMYVDIGAYGAPKTANYNSVKTTKQLESFVMSIDGFQMLYADSYLSKEDFYKMFDHTLYNQVRKQYDCESAFPEIYNKVNRSARS